MESLEQLKEIVENAPKGATHVDNDFVYYQYEKADTVAVWREFTNHNTSFVLSQCVCMFGLRSLSDIKLIIEFMERVNKLEFMVDNGLGEKDMVRDL